MLTQPLEGFVQGQQDVGRGSGHGFGLVEINAPALPAVLPGLAFDQRIGPTRAFTTSGAASGTTLVLNVQAGIGQVRVVRAGPGPTTAVPDAPAVPAAPSAPAPADHVAPVA